MFYIQVFIAVCGLTGAVLTYVWPGDLRKYACAINLLAQPGWVYAGWYADQFGMVVVSATYSIIFCVSFFQMWLRPCLSRMYKTEHR